MSRPWPALGRSTMEEVGVNLEGETDLSVYWRRIMHRILWISVSNLYPDTNSLTFSGFPQSLQTNWGGISQHGPRPLFLALFTDVHSSVTKPLGALRLSSELIRTAESGIRSPVIFFSGLTAKPGRLKIFTSDMYCWANKMPCLVYEWSTDYEEKTFILDGHITNLNNVLIHKVLNQNRTYLVIIITTPVNTRKILTYLLHGAESFLRS